MLMHMRTTLVVDDQILKQARRKARELGLTLSAYVTEALQKDLTAKVPGRRKPFRLITVKGGGLQPGFNWDRLDQQVQELDDLEVLRGRR